MSGLISLLDGACNIYTRAVQIAKKFGNSSFHIFTVLHDGNRVLSIFNRSGEDLMWFEDDEVLYEKLNNLRISTIQSYQPNFFMIIVILPYIFLGPPLNHHPKFLKYHRTLFYRRDCKEDM